MNKVLLSALLCCAASVTAQQPGVTNHTKAEMDHIFADLLTAAPASPMGLATKTLDDHGPSRVILVARVKSGEAEMHEQWADEFFVNSGTLTVVVGGQMVGKHPTDPGEFRGTALTGNVKKYVLHAGDILHIPIGVPHWSTLEPGAKVTYFSFKEK